MVHTTSHENRSRNESESLNVKREGKKKGELTTTSLLLFALSKVLSSGRLFMCVIDIVEFEQKLSE